MKRTLSAALGLPVTAFALGTIALSAASGVSAQQRNMTFFVTSISPGKGGDLGGLAGADQHCQLLAQAVGAGNHTWHAYLSLTASGGTSAVNARDRIGPGPWRNAKGAIIAKSVADLHGPESNLTKQTALTEKGETVNGRDDQPNMHDILTGSQMDGRAYPPGEVDTTCGNWTQSGEGSAVVGHHDRLGLRDDDSSRSWNSSHATRGCSPDALKVTGGSGLLYCFATN